MGKPLRFSLYSSLAVRGLDFGTTATLLVSNSESRGDRKFHVTDSFPLAPSSRSRGSRSYLTQSHTHKTQEKVLWGERLLRDASSPKRRYLQPDSEIEMKKGTKKPVECRLQGGKNHASWFSAPLVSSSRHGAKFRLAASHIALER